jgi:hypothetical protein
VPWRLLVSPPPGTAGSKAFISPGATRKKGWNIHRPPSSTPSSSTGATGGADGAQTGNLSTLPQTSSPESRLQGVLMYSQSLNQELRKTGKCAKIMQFLSS